MQGPGDARVNVELAMYSLVEISILNAITASALALAALVIGRMLRRPAVIHAVWLLVLLKLVTPPIFEIPVGLRLQPLASMTLATDAATEIAVIEDALPSQYADSPPVVVHSWASDLERRSDEVIGGHVGAAATPSRVALPPVELIARATPPRWMAVIVLMLLSVWGGGSVVWFVVQSWRIVLFTRLASTARLASHVVQQQAQQLAASIGVRRVPAVCALDVAMSPILWGVGRRTRVIFPAELLNRIDEKALATLLTHELAHYRRGDHWVRLLEFVVTGLFWWHPAVWIARREIEIAEEHCCDAWVVDQFPGQPRCYAEALLDTIDFLSEARPRIAPVATGLGQAPFLRQRIRRIMSGVAPKSMSGTTRLVVLTAAAIFLPLGPQLFEGAIRKADAALETLDLNALAETISKSATPERASPLADQLAKLRGMAEQGEIEPIESEPSVASDTEPAAWAIVNSPDGRFLAVAKSHGGLVMKDTFQQRSFDLAPYQISSIAFVPHRDLLAAGSADSKVYLFDCASGEPVAALAGHQAAVGSVAVSLDGQYVISGSRDGEVKLWDIDYEREVPSRIPAQASVVNSVRFSHDGRLLAIASGDWRTSGQGAVVLWDLRGGTAKQRFDTASPVGAVAFGVDRLIAAEWNGRTTAWDLASGTTVALGTIGKDTVSAANFAADAQSMLLAASDDAELQSATTPLWFLRMDRDRDGKLAWNEFQGPRGTFRNLDVDADEIITLDEVNAL